MHLLTAADLTMVIENISPANPPSSKDAQISYFALLGLLRRRSRHVYVAWARIHEDLLKVFLNPQPVCKNLLQKWLLALSFYL